MSAKKPIAVVEASQLITNLHETTFRQTRELLGAQTGTLLADKAGQFMLMLWFEAALLTVLTNSKQQALAAKIRAHRVKQFTEIFGIDTGLVENVLDSYTVTQKRAAQYGSNNFMLNHLLLFMEVPEDQLMDYSLRFDILTGVQFAELMLNHAKAVHALHEHYSVQ